MKIEIEVHSPEEILAFSEFLGRAAADRQRRQEESNSMFGLGGINRAANPLWQTAPAPGVYETMDEAQQKELKAEIQRRIDEPETETPAEAPAEPKKRGRPAKKAEAKPEPVAEAEPQIRANPENRVEEPEEDAIQDIQDEIAEVEATRNPVAPLTVDDVRQALGGYVKKFGTPAALEDGAKLLAQALGTPPEGEPIWKMSILPDDQDALRKAAETVNAAIEGNPFSREAI